MKLIGTQECKDEILVEYKQNLNVSKSIQDVANRHRLLEEEKKRKEELKEKLVQKMSEEADIVIKEDNQPQVLEAPKVEEKQEEILILKFTVRGTRMKLKELKKFLEDGGYDYE